jgi:hypothetical protein
MLTKRLVSAGAKNISYPQIRKYMRDGNNPAGDYWSFGQPNRKISPPPPPPKKNSKTVIKTFQALFIEN